NGWYADPACTTLYDFSAPVTGDLTLYAGWKMVGFEGSRPSSDAPDTPDVDEPDVEEPDVEEPDIDIGDDDTPLNPAPSFTDIPDGHWAGEAIDAVV
ncbi:InlB B-repeat-containing protein, partial [Pseudoflavonifractor phocaeensis]